MGLQDKWIGYLKERNQEVVNEITLNQYSLLKTFSFTSVGGGTGTSTIILYIAQYLAKEQNKQVCVVDLDFLQPDLLYNLNVDVTTENTILNYLKGLKKLQDCYIEDELIPNLRLVTASPKDPLELLLNLRTDEDVIGNLIDQVQNVFDYVLINLPYRQPFITFIEPISRIDRGYLVADERLSALMKIKGILSFIQSYQGKASIFNQLILNKRTEYDYPYEKIKEINCELVSEIPYEEDLIHYMNVRKPLINQKVSVEFQKAIFNIIEDMLQ